MKRDLFEKRLREGTEAGFSEELHARVMAGVRRERVGVRRESIGMWWRVGAVAAGVVIVAGVWWGVNREREMRKIELGAEVLSEVPGIERVVRENVGPVRERMREARFAYLDRDGKRLAGYLWRQVPGVGRRGEGAS